MGGDDTEVHSLAKAAMTAETGTYRWMAPEVGLRCTRMALNQTPLLF